MALIFVLCYFSSFFSPLLIFPSQFEDFKWKYRNDLCESGSNMSLCSFTQVDRIKASRGERGGGASTKTDVEDKPLIRHWDPWIPEQLLYGSFWWVSGCVCMSMCVGYVHLCVSEHVPTSAEKPDEDVGCPAPSLSAVSPRDRVSHLDLDWQLAHPRIPLVSEPTAQGS